MSDIKDPVPLKYRDSQEDLSSTPKLERPRITMPFTLLNIFGGTEANIEVGSS